MSCVSESRERITAAQRLVQEALESLLRRGMEFQEVDLLVQANELLEAESAHKGDALAFANSLRAEVEREGIGS